MIIIQRNGIEAWGNNRNDEEIHIHRDRVKEEKARKLMFSYLLEV